jgi:chromosome segregation ATPase
MESERDAILAKHRRDRESIEVELEERRQECRKLEGEAKEAAAQRTQMKRQIEEYEGKVKKLIIEFEEESKKHIRELNEVHE